MKNKHIFTLLSILIIAALLAASFPSPAQAALCKKTVVVRAGDTIQEIAQRYHSTVAKIAYANNLDRPYTLTPGQTLCVPKENVPSTRFKWTGSIKGNQLVLTGDDFRKDHTFLVNIKDTSKDRFYNLGKTVTNSLGDLNARFTLPAQYQTKNYLKVCLKDPVSKLNSCKKVFKQ